MTLPYHLAFSLMIAGLALSPVNLTAETDTLTDSLSPAVSRQNSAEQHFRLLLSQPKVEPFKFALAALWLNERVGEANDAILEELKNLRHSSAAGLAKKDAKGETQEPALDLANPDSEVFLPEVAGSEYVKWKARTINRVYWLFHQGSEHFPGRLTPEVEKELHKLFFAFARKKSVIARLDSAWATDTSENHQMMGHANAFLFVQALSQVPAYAKRKLDDGFTVEQHLKAWQGYFHTYCRERARWGLYWEVHSPTYGKWFLPDLINTHDFSSDPSLRQQVGDLLTLTWAVWSTQQLNGVTGGAKTRCYLDSSLAQANADSWAMMAGMLLDRPVADHERRAVAFAAHNTAMQTGGVIYTSLWFPPALVRRMMTEDLGRFACRQLRPFREQSLPADFPVEVFENPSRLRLMQAEDSRSVQYTWRTPHYLMGSFFTDPQVEYGAGASQNRINSIIFDSDRNARIVPVCGSNHPTGTKHYRQHVSIQHENVMLVAKNNVSSERATQSRVFFSRGLKERTHLTDQGWYVLTTGKSFAAIRPVPWSGNDPAAFWLDERHLEMTKESTPFIIVVSDRETHSSVEAFQEWLESHDVLRKDDTLTYTFADSSGVPTTLTLFRDVKQLPQKNGKTVDLKPPFTFDGKLIQSRRGSDRVELRFGGESMVLEFGE